MSSTELVARIGDAQYKTLREGHERQVRLAVEAHDGQLVTVMGDGTLSVFTSPTQAVRCAEVIRREAYEAGVVVRCGAHTGELERDGRNITGLNVHVGARVGSAAGAGEIVVSDSVHGLLGGSGLSFESRGKHDLKGVPGRWELFALTADAGQPIRDQSEVSSIQTSLDRMVLHTARRMPSVMRTAVRAANALERRRVRALGTRES